MLYMFSHITGRVHIETYGPTLSQIIFIISSALNDDEALSIAGK